jgi:molybdopterin/thiamine biosynthesis adenylyltransferase
MTATQQWMSRYSRQILLAKFGGIGQKKLSEGSVGLVGSGPIAMPFFLYGVGAGIGRWGVLESEENSGNRLAYEANIRNPEIEVEITGYQQLANNLEQWVNRWPVVVETSNNPTVRQQLAAACHTTKIALISAWSSGQTGWLLQSPCPTCLTEPAPAPTSTNPLDNMVPGVLGCALAQQVINTLLEPSSSLAAGKLTIFQAANSQFLSQKADRDPNCPTCKD